MATPAIPPNFAIQQGNGQVYLSWSFAAGALSYKVQRSSDGVAYADLGTTTSINYLDTTVTIGLTYYYQIASVNGLNQSNYATPQSIVPTLSADMCLGQVRLASQQRADRVNSNFVTMVEWNSYINQSYFELYDLLVTTYEDYYLAPPVQIQTVANINQYALPDGLNYNGVPALYKLMGVDCALNPNSNAWFTLKKFDFIARNRYVYPNITSSPLGVFNMQYRMMGNNLIVIPAPSAGQLLQVWYVPRLQQLLQDTDIMDGVSGWTEYVICDAAIKALQKEESDVSVLMIQKQALIKRIEDSAMNRDAGQGDTISNTRTQSDRWGGMGGMDNGPTGGW